MHLQKAFLYLYCKMNFEEILDARDSGGAHLEKLPIGQLYKKQIEKKYCYVLSVNPALLAEPGFRKGLEADYQKNQYSRIKQQLHYTIAEDSDGSVLLELEPGSYQSFSKLLETNPAIVAKSGFVDNVISNLLEGVEQLHAQSVYHLCFAPQNLLIRKGDEMPMMLLHGSSFGKLGGMKEAFAGMENYLAPEVQAGEEASVRSDIYSIGRFILRLFEQGDAPFEYKRVIKKALCDQPEKRYASIAELRSDLQKMRSLKNSFIGFLAALAIVLFSLWMYVELMPEGEDVEFVEAAPKEVEHDVFDESFSPVDSIEMEILGDSSGVLDTITVEERQAMELYLKKSEEIFRKQFYKEADRILSKIYSNEHMNASEKKFLTTNNAMRDELLKVQNAMAEQAGISDDVAGRISTEIIDRIVLEKQKQLELNSSQPNMTSKTENDSEE